MKKHVMKSVSALFLCLALIFSLAGCAQETQNESSQSLQESSVITTESSVADSSQESAAQEESSQAGEASLWDAALYTEDTELGEGAKDLLIVVEAEDQKITFTIHTDAETVGDALVENELVEGDEGEYGLYITAVNGITADYDADQAYWAFYQNGEYMNTGVDATEFTSGDQYELVYTKG